MSSALSQAGASRAVHIHHGIPAEPFRVPAHDEGQSVDSVRLIPVELISVNPFQPRRHFDPQEMDDLAQSIRATRAEGGGIEGTGIEQNLIVRYAPITPDGRLRYILVAGERRFRAAKMIGLPVVPCSIRDLNEQQALEVAIIENLQREDVQPLEEAWAYRQLIEQGHTIRSAAEATGKKKHYVEMRLNLIKYSDAIQSMVASRSDTLRAAEVIAKAPEEKQQALIDSVLSRELNLRALELKVGELRGKVPASLSGWTDRRESSSNGDGAPTRDFHASGVYGTPQAEGVVILPQFSLERCLSAATSQLRAAVDASSGATVSPEMWHKLAPHLREARDLLEELQALRKSSAASSTSQAQPETKEQ